VIVEHVWCRQFEIFDWITSHLAIRHTRDPAVKAQLYSTCLAAAA